jgi:predicted Rossmann-fold nucleotide-binding protein
MDLNIHINSGPRPQGQDLIARSNAAETELANIACVRWQHNRKSITMNEMKQRAEAKKKAKAAGKQLTDAELNGVAGGGGWG